MFVDALLLVSDAQAITADAVSTNTIDLGNPTVKNRIGTGEPVAFGLQVDVAADFTTGDETYAVEIISSASANLSTPTVLARYVFVAAAGGGALAAGKKYVLPVPPGMPSQRYIGLNYDVGGTTPSVTVTAFLSMQAMIDPEWTVYAKGYNV
jgi:hypothetical protein